MKVPPFLVNHRVGVHNKQEGGGLIFWKLLDKNNTKKRLKNPFYTLFLQNWEKLKVENPKIDYGFNIRCQSNGYLYPYANDFDE